MNPAIRAVTLRAEREGYQVLGIKRGWAGFVDLVPEDDADNTSCFQLLTESRVEHAARTGGTFLHSSRTRPSHLPKSSVLEHLMELLCYDRKHHPINYAAVLVSEGDLKPNQFATFVPIRLPDTNFGIDVT